MFIGYFTLEFKKIDLAYLSSTAFQEFQMFC